MNRLVNMLIIIVIGLQMSPSAKANWFDQKVAEQPAVKKVIEYLDEHFQQQVAQWITISEIPAPPGQEKMRAKYISAQFRQLGLIPQNDELGNIWVVLKGIKQGPTLLFAAHMDTVFDADTDVKVTRKNGRLYGPGVWDNSASVANMLAVVEAMVKTGYQPQGDVIFLATVQEEAGLVGMKYFMKKQSNNIDYVAALDGNLGPILYGALGIYWMDMTFTAAGAHSVNSYNQPHPAKAAAHCILDIYDIDLDIKEHQETPLGIFNVGQVHGGKIYNGIPPEVNVTVDLRSADPKELKRLNSEITQACKSAADNESVSFELSYKVKNAAGGTINKMKPAFNGDFVQTIISIQSYTGALKQGQIPAIATGSTDANIGVVRGLPSFSMGRSYGKDQHTLGEWADIASAKVGTNQIIYLLAALDASQQ